MSDWLERQLARDLAPVRAPEALGIRLGFRAARRWDAPRVALAVAAAVVCIIGAGYAASRTAAFDLGQVAAQRVAPAETLELASTEPEAVAEWLRREAGGGVPVRPGAIRPTFCDRGGDSPLQVNGAKATVLLAHAPAEIPDHVVSTAQEAGCRFCHTL